MIIPPIVQEQIRDQIRYIAQDSIHNALAWEDRLRRAIEIGDMPGHAIDEDASDRLGFTIRKCVFEKTYLIHYRLSAALTDVEIVNFRHGIRLPTAL